MTTLKNNEYIVFQPDQVLTNDHLNQLFYYLDRQNRLTRNKLFGMGIVCGLELEVVLAGQSISSIQINKGCGITSEGYLIIENKDKIYTHALPYAPPDIPADLPFSCDYVPFYNYSKSDNNKNKICNGIYKLVTCDQYNTIIQNPNSKPQAIPCPPSAVTPAPGANTPKDNDQSLPIPLASKDWSEYVAVLFLEAKEKDLKNCDIQDCNNNGEKITFHIRPLLVPIGCVTNNCGRKDDNLKAPELRFKRFNVTTNNPANDISSTAGILKTFQNIFNGASPNIFDQISRAYTFCYTKYNTYLPLGSSPFPVFSSNLSATFSQIQNTYLIQYFYDYINDLILAYYEFREVVAEINVQCCADECAFPLHLVLGLANKSTNEFVKDCYRTYFIYSPLFDGDKRSIARLRFYYHRMEILAAQFQNGNFPVPSIDEKGKQIIKITPSQHKDFPLSQRAIPYYYPEDQNDQNSLYHYWNFEKTTKGNEAFNLSYNAYLYNSADPLVNDPLLYDIEKYNFFRIEGHIGKPYVYVMNDLLTQIQQYNLPFNVVAVAADTFFLTKFDIPALICYIKDLLPEYESRLIEFICKLLLCLKQLSQKEFVAGKVATALSDKAVLANETDNSGPQDFLKSFQFGSSVYKLGELFKSSGQNTIGYTYASAINNNQFRNPIDINNLNCDNLEDSQSNFASFNILYAADTLFQTLLNTQPKDLGSSVVETQYKDFDTQFTQFRNRITASSKVAGGSSFSTALFDGCACDCLPCLFLDVLLLLEQIILRIRQYESEMIFENYSAKHRGLTPGGGVCEAGTFVLVYSDVDLTPKPKPIIQLRSVNEIALSEVRTPTIIADFFLPYLCCSDCSPMITAVQAPAPTLSIKTAFCSNEKSATQIIISPKDNAGKVVATSQNSVDTSKIVLQDSNGDWWLDPSPVRAMDVLNLLLSLTYQLNGSVSPSSAITIYKLPDSAFSFAGNISRMVFTPNIKNDPSLVFKWTFYQDFGDGKGDVDVTADFRQHTKELVSVQYQIEATIRYLDLNSAVSGSVGLQVINGTAEIACTSITKQQVYPVPPGTKPLAVATGKA